jgi:hypothetical protein
MMGQRGNTDRSDRGSFESGGGRPAGTNRNEQARAHQTEWGDACFTQSGVLLEERRFSQAVSGVSSEGEFDAGFETATPCWWPADALSIGAHSDRNPAIQSGEVGGKLLADPCRPRAFPGHAPEYSTSDPPMPKAPPGGFCGFPPVTVDPAFCPRQQVDDSVPRSTCVSKLHLQGFPTASVGTLNGRERYPCATILGVILGGVFRCGQFSRAGQIENFPANGR